MAQVPPLHSDGHLLSFVDVALGFASATTDGDAQMSGDASHHTPSAGNVILPSGTHRSDVVGGSTEHPPHQPGRTPYGAAAAHDDSHRRHARILEETLQGEN